MTTLNAYATLAEYKSWIAVRGGSVSTDASDDAVIEILLRSASRYIDSQTVRQFYPSVETRYYDVPKGRTLILDDDLLEVITITNGDGNTIPSTEYILESANVSPHWGITIRRSSSYYWTWDSNGDTEGVLEVTGVWGFHDHYNLAWLIGSTANEPMDTSETGYDVTSSSLFAIGNIIRFDNELGYVSAVGTNTLTTTRGENGSTAATHLTGINVYIWQMQDNIKNACLSIAQSVYGARSGQTSGGKITVTAAGVVIRPEDVPPFAADIIENYRKQVIG
jgi:hypothetical protein